MGKIIKGSFRGLVLSGLLILAVGCRTQLIQNDLSAAITASSVDKAREGIMAGLASLNWQGYEKDKGHIVATKKLTKYLYTNRMVEPVSYMAQVDIFYDANRYRIKYKNSTNLKYDGQHIHKLYNQWIHALDQAIRANTH